MHRPIRLVDVLDSAKVLASTGLAHFCQLSGEAHTCAAVATAPSSFSASDGSPDLSIFWAIVGWSWQVLAYHTPGEARTAPQRQMVQQACRSCGRSWDRPGRCWPTTLLVKPAARTAPQRQMVQQACRSCGQSSDVPGRCWPTAARLVTPAPHLSVRYSRLVDLVGDRGIVLASAGRWPTALLPFLW